MFVIKVFFLFISRVNPRKKKYDREAMQNFCRKCEDHGHELFPLIAQNLNNDSGEVTEWLKINNDSNAEKLKILYCSVLY